MAYHEDPLDGLKKLFSVDYQSSYESCKVDCTHELEAPQDSIIHAMIMAA